MTVEVRREVAGYLVEQLDAFEDLKRQRDSARAWAVELEQRNEEAARLIDCRVTRWPDAVKAIDVLRGES